MREIKTEQRIVLQVVCCKCGKHQGHSDDRSKFCECGQSVEKLTEVRICPFCGEELTDSHIDTGFYSCDGAFTLLLTTNDGMILYDGDFWFANKYQDYDVTRYILEPASNDDAYAHAQEYYRVMNLEAQCAEKAMEEINKPDTILNEVTGSPFNRRLDQ